MLVLLSRIKCGEWLNYLRDAKANLNEAKIQDE